MNLKTLRRLLPIILLVASFAPIAEATFLTVYVQDTQDDAFITQNGNYFGLTPYLPLRSESSNLILGTRFRSVNIPQGAKINNATLRVRTNFGYPTAGDIRVTITGDDIDNSAAFNDSSSFTRTYTHAYTVWNISEVNGAGWNTVDVTAIVQEIVDRIGWVSGNDLSLVFFTDKGTPRREFATIDANPGYRPRIDIFHSVEPTPEEEEVIQDDLPAPFNDTEDYTFEYNDTYRGIDIWILREIGRWLNFSTFTAMGANSGKISGLNDTWFQATNVYQDSDVYLRRDYGEHRNNASSMVSVKFGIKTEALPWQAPTVQGYVNMWGVSTEQDTAFHWTNGYSYAYRIYTDRANGLAWSVDAGALKDSLTWSPTLFETGLPWTLYYHIVLNQSSGATQIDIYNDIEMTDLNATYSSTFAPGAGWPYTPLYEFLIAPTEAAGLNTGFTGEYISNFGNETLDEQFWLVYPNGTIIGEVPDGVDPFDEIDDILGGAQPEDPQEEEYGPLNKFSWKLLVLAVGMVMLLGSPMAGIAYGADTAAWIKIMYIMFFGLGILWAIKSM